MQVEKRQRYTMPRYDRLELNTKAATRAKRSRANRSVFSMLAGCVRRSHPTVPAGHSLSFVATETPNPFTGTVLALGRATAVVAPDEARRIAKAIARTPEFMMGRRGFYARAPSNYRWSMARPFHVAFGPIGMASTRFVPVPHCNILIFGLALNSFVATVTSLRICGVRRDQDDQKNGIYVLTALAIDGAGVDASGVLILRDGKIYGGDSYVYYVGTYECSGGEWEGAMLIQGAYSN